MKNFKKFFVVVAVAGLLVSTVSSTYANNCSGVSVEYGGADVCIGVSK